ncbi:MAG: hypothetical protein WAQ28_19625 [Bacteroidia bacterium]
MNKKQLVGLIVIALTGLAVFYFVATKAKLASFTHDESYSYNFYVHNSSMDIISHKNSYTNNHLLNTLMMKYSEQLFGASELFLRLPNLILLLVCFVYMYLFTRNCNLLLGISIMVIMFTNIDLIDFFGLARGYGISIGFMIMSLYHLVRALHTNNNKLHLVLFNMAALLAILGNFTMLDFYVAAIIAFNAVKLYESRFVLKEKFSFYKTNKTNIFMFVLMLVVLYEPVRRVITYNQFDFGGTKGFFSDTMQALVLTVFSHEQNVFTQTVFVKMLFLLLLFVPLVIVIVNAIKRKTGFFENNKALVTVNLVLLFIYVEIILQHLLLHTDYLIGRFALFLFPLFILNIFFLLEYSLKFKFRNLILGLCVVLAGYSIIYFYRNVNVHTSAEWSYDMETKNAMNALAAWHDKNETDKTGSKLAVNWLFEPTTNFYRRTRSLQWLVPVSRDEPDQSSDYYYIFKEDLNKLQLKNYTTIFSSDRTNTVLVKNNL